jgi:hypothetical protein
VVAGHVVTLAPDGKLVHFGTLGYVYVGTSLVALTLLWLLQRSIHVATVPVSIAP